MKRKVLGLFFLLSLTCSAVWGGAAEIVCEGAYGGHLQGVCTDGTNIWWSFTVEIVRTDLSGKVLATRKARAHQGDLCVKGGLVYVAANHGRFNTENLADSWVEAYDAATLEPKKAWKLPEVPHGAGGMTWKGDRFYVVGGLPPTHTKNYVYEYTADFKFVKRHDLETGYTVLGIQTASWEGDRFLFGIYGAKNNPAGVLACPANLTSFRRHRGGGEVGMATINGTFYFARTTIDAEAKQAKRPSWRAKLFPSKLKIKDQRLKIEN